MAKRVELATSRRLAVEPRLRQQPGRRRRSRRRRARAGRPRGGGGSSRPRRGCGERDEEEDVLPRGDDVERRAAHARVPERRHREVVEDEPDGEDDECQPCEAHGHVEATSVNQRLSMRTGPGNSDRRSDDAEEVVLPRPRLLREVVRTARHGLGQPVDEREPRVHLDREPAVRRGHEDPPADAQRLADERLLTHARAHVLDDGVRVHDVERRVAERERARVALHVRDVRVALPEAGAVVEAERGDPLRPRVVLLEEVVRHAATLAPRVAEGDLVHADVEHGRRHIRPHQFEEERELAPARAERDRIGEPHGRWPSVPSQ